jgi:hypothetical protein
MGSSNRSAKRKDFIDISNVEHQRKGATDPLRGFEEIGNGGGVVHVDVPCCSAGRSTEARLENRSLGREVRQASKGLTAPSA